MLLTVPQMMAVKTQKVAPECIYIPIFLLKEMGSQADAL